MEITGRDGNCHSIKRVTSLSSNMKKNTSDQREAGLTRPLSPPGTENKSIRSQIKKTGPISKTRKKAVVPQSAVNEDIDFDKQLGKESCFDDNECMWLSSDISSPSSFFEEYRLPTSLHLHVDEWLISWLSTLANSYLHLDEESSPSYDSSVNSREETSLAVERTTLDAEKILLKDLKKERQLTLLPKSLENDAVDSSVTSSESASSSCDQRCEDSTGCDNSLTPCSTMFDSTSTAQISHLDRTNFLVPLVNLEDEDAQWISDKDLDLDYFQSNFPSPSCKSSFGSEVLSSSSILSIPSAVKDACSQSDISSELASSEAAYVEDFNTDEPLFWPFELNWCSDETWKSFSMSPRRDTMKLETPEVTSSKSIGSKFNCMKTDSKEASRRRLVITSGSTAAKILGWKRIKNVKSVKRVNNMPSTLRKSTKISVKVVPLETADTTKEAQDCIPELNCMDRDFVMNDFASDVQLPIESLLGLGEFNGHEGVDTEINDDVFSLDDSL